MHARPEVVAGENQRRRPPPAADIDAVPLVRSRSRIPWRSNDFGSRGNGGIDQIGRRARSPGPPGATARRPARQERDDVAGPTGSPSDGPVRNSRPSFERAITLPSYFR